LGFFSSSAISDWNRNSNLKNIYISWKGPDVKGGGDLNGATLVTERVEPCHYSSEITSVNLFF
jgi:hypothetical protein